MMADAYNPFVDALAVKRGEKKMKDVAPEHRGTVANLVRNQVALQQYREGQITPRRFMGGRRVLREVR
jgi:hypothetical protein